MPSHMRRARAGARRTNVPEISAFGLTCEVVGLSCVIAGAFIGSSCRGFFQSALEIEYQRLAGQRARHAHLDVVLALLVGQHLVAMVGAPAHEPDPAG